MSRVRSTPCSDLTLNLDGTPALLSPLSFPMAKRLRDESLSSEEVECIDSSARALTAELEPRRHKCAALSAIQTSSSTAMLCSLPPHGPLSFPTYAQYEAHYHGAHSNRCSECNSNFPTTRFLELHLAEHHDPIVASKRDAGEKTYACFVEGCEKLCADWKKRRSHLVDRHGFPKNYDFLTVNHGIDGRRSMLRPGVDAEGHRKSSRERERDPSSPTAKTESTEATSISDHAEPASPTPPQRPIGNVESTQPADGDPASSLDAITASMSSLKMVPRSVTFGKRRGRSGFAKS